MSEPLPVEEIRDTVRTNYSAAAIRIAAGQSEAADVVISNCVINLAAAKTVVLREAARVLRPGRPVRGVRRDRRPRPGPVGPR